ncbi:unnamed protein product [Boreogadus saida]
MRDEEEISRCGRGVMDGCEAGLILTWRSLAVSLRSAPVPDGTSAGLGEPPSWLQNVTMTSLLYVCLNTGSTDTTDLAH